MNDLVQFLRDRLDEDAELARQAAERGPLAQRNRDADVRLGPRLANRRRLAEQGVPEALDDAPQAHAARHDPARVLAEVDAKRQLVKLHGRATLHAGGSAQHFATATACRSCESNYQFPELSWPCPTLRLLALPYADHPDYRDEWRP